MSGTATARTSAWAPLRVEAFRRCAAGGGLADRARAPATRRERAGGADASRFVEVAQYPSWAEHLRQHGGRLTGSDRASDEAARAATVGTLQVQHLLPPVR